ncbi:hypothetical protein DPMN_146393, partial [Dreissena polymorpha]
MMGGSFQQSKSARTRWYFTLLAVPTRSTQHHDCPFPSMASSQGAAQEAPMTLVDVARRLPLFIQEFVGEGVVAMKDYVHNVTREYFQNNSGVERTIVLAPPEILTPPGNKAVTVAERVVLACSVGGDPPPKVVWLKNGRPVKLSDRIRQLNTGSLVIYDFTVLSYLKFYDKLLKGFIGED